MRDILVNDYITLNSQFKNLYGAKTILFMQNGAFFDAYDIVQDADHLQVCKHVLGITVSAMNRMIQGTNPYMAGFPLDSFAKNARKLVHNGYTVVKMIQKNGGKIVDQILSPGCHISDDDTSQSVLTTALFVEQEFNTHLAYAKFDANTGKIEFSSVVTENITESMKMLKDLLYEMGDTNELLVYYKGDAWNEFSKTAKFEVISLHIHNIVEKRRLNVFDPLFQTFFFERTFNHYSHLGGTIFMNLDMQDTTIEHRAVIILLIMFINNHDESISEKLTPPTMSDNTNTTRVSCMNSVFEKMDIFTNKKGLFDILNVTQTKMGERLLRNILRNPINDGISLNNRYDLLNHYSLFEEESKKEARRSLQKFWDMDRLERKLSLKKCTPSDIHKIYQNFINAEIIHENIEIFHDDIEHLRKLISFIESVFEINKLKNNEYAIKDNINDELDLYHFEKKKIEMNLTKIQQFFEHVLSDTSESSMIKRCENQDEWCFQTTVVRAKQLEKTFSNVEYVYNTIGIRYGISIENIKQFNVVYSKKCAILRGHFDDDFHKLFELNNNIMESSKHIFSNKIQELLDLCSITPEIISKKIGEVDVFLNLSIFFEKNRYVRPILTEEIGTINALKLRHPIVQKLVTENGNRYISNDVFLSPKNCWLLYGVNSVGKSTLLKSIVINTLMAQSGLFVAADTFEFCPFNHIACRIGNTDDIYLAQSSYVKELVEMNTIFSRCKGPFSLIVTDEICSSTERKSAVNVFASFVQVMTERKMTFACATHLFELQQNRYIQGLSSVLKNMHLKVRIENKTVIYDRLLHYGLPEYSNYGIEVASSIIHDPRFKTLLRSSWHDEEDVPLDTMISKSLYNTKVLKVKCELCSYRPRCNTDKKLHTHHIEFQCHADRFGNISENVHKNVSSNLITLCEECHMKVHANLITIFGYTDTSSGSVLDYKIN